MNNQNSISKPFLPKIATICRAGRAKNILQAVLSMVVFEESSRAKKSICNLWKVVYELLYHVLVM